jgi:hypothetical protein
MVIILLIFGYFYLSPIDYERLAASSFFTIFYVSNIYFSHLTGYFQPSVVLIPLIHTWTLGVEEQYYLFYPVFLLIMQKGYPNIAFYYFPTRAWEFMLGGIIALGGLPKINSKIFSNILAVIGIFFIIYAILGHLPNSELRIILACIGTVLIIYSSTSMDNFVKGMLSTKGFVFIGLLSYSLYLWHWPILSCYRYFGTLLPRTTNIIALIVTFVLIFILSYLSYRFIETPILNMDFSPNHKRLFVPIAGIMLVIVSFSVYIYYNYGLPNRFSSNIQRIMQAPLDIDISPLDIPQFMQASIDTDIHKPNYMLGNTCELKWDELPTLGDKSAKHFTFVLMGDSHASAIAPAFDLIAKELGVKGKLFAQGLNIPFFGIDLGGQKGLFLDRNNVFYKSKRVFLLLVTQHPHINKIFLAAQWADYIHGQVIKDEDLQPHNSSTLKNNAEVFERGLDKTLKIFTQMNKKVYILDDVPAIAYDVPEKLFARAILMRYFKFKTTNLIVPDFKHYYEREKIDFNLFKQAQRYYNFTEIKLYKALCVNDEPCKIITTEGYPIYVDQDHLSIHGSLYVASKMREDFIKILKSDKIEEPIKNKSHVNE